MHNYAAAPSLMYIADRPDRTFVRGEGSWLYDAEGNRYLDFVQGWAVNSLGHSSPVVRDALLEQASRVINVGPAYFNVPMCELAERLACLSSLSRVFFANSGAEANEGALKLARKWGSVRRNGAYEVIVFEDAFHGRTLAMMSASGKPQWKNLYEPKLPGFIRVPREDLSAVRSAIGPATAAVMLEPIQGEAGVIPFSESFLWELSRMTEECGVLLILDEIQTGVGRTGRMFCYEHAGIRPDIVTLGKGIGGGVPLAAVLAREEVCLFDAGDQGGTFNGNALMTAVGLAVLKEIARPEFLTAVQTNGEYLRSRLQHLGQGEVRGRGLLLAMELNQPNASKVVEAGMESGLLINAARPSVLRFMPALNVTPHEIDHMMETLGELLTRLASPCRGGL